MGMSFFFSLILLAHGLLIFTECRSQIRERSDYLINSNVTNLSRKSMSTEAVSKCSQSIIRDRIYVNCSSEGIHHIPDLPKESYAVDLSCNNIDRIPDKQFIGLHLLQLLDLSHNPLVFIEVNAFYGLNKLSQLYIRHSKLFKLNPQNIEEIVSQLPALTILSLTLKKEQGSEVLNITHCACPDAASVIKHQQFNALSQLSRLEIDASFLKGIAYSATVFWKIKELEIRITKHCFYKYFTKTCFQNLSFLKKLTIRFNDPYPVVIVPFQYKLVSFANNTFDNLKNMEILEIQTTYRIPYIPWITKRFNMTDHFNKISTSVSHLKKFKSLSLRGISYGLDPTFSLKIALSPLRISSTIESLDISRNGIIGNFDDLSYFPLTLKKITARSNCLSFLFVAMQLGLWTSVDTFDASDQHYCIGATHKRGKLHKMESNFNTIETLTFTHSIFRITFVELQFFLKLKHLDLSWNSNNGNDKSLDRGSLTQMPLLKFIDLSGFGFETLEEDALAHRKLQVLNMSSNSLGNMGCSLSKRFTNLPSLVHLRLSDNKIQCLKENTFVGLKAIQTIDLSINFLESFQIALKNLTYLRMLNLSNNYIRGLTKMTMNDLDSLHNASVDLGKNKLVCNCESLAFLRWLQQNKDRFLGINYYTCAFNNNSFVYLEILRHIISELDRSCASHTTLIIVSCILLASTLSLVLGGVAYRYRWKLRYLYYMTRLQIQHKETRGGYEQLFDYDAFISYASGDFEVARVNAMEYLEDKKGFRLCIHERDFKPGESISYNISKGIHSSKRTFLFFSKAFLQSEWCLYELNIARMETMYKKRDVILVIILENIPKDEMTIEMIDFLGTYTYLEYPKDNKREDKEVFWNKCADFINGP